jgi:hypothetical protein
MRSPCIARLVVAPLDVSFAHQLPANLSFSIAAKKNAMRQDARAFAGAAERADDMQEVGVIALLGRRRAEGLESLIRVIGSIYAGAPALIGKRRIRDDIVERFEGISLHKLWIGERVPLHNQRRGIVVQDHIHPGQCAGGGVLFLSVERDFDAGLIAHLQQQRSRAAGGIIDRSGTAYFRIMYSQDLRDDPADFRGGVELAFALAALRGKVPHQVFIGIAQDVVAIGAVLAEIECLVFKDGDEIGKPFHHFLAAAELRGLIEIRHIR